jgi:hypothetical protein
MLSRGQAGEGRGRCGIATGSLARSTTGERSRAEARKDVVRSMGRFDEDAMDK